MLKMTRYFNWLHKKPKKQENGRASGLTNSETPVSYLHQQQPGTPSPYSLHRSIKSLPYENFVLVLTEEELSHIIISGNPPIDELVIAWENITTEYSQSIQSDKSRSIFECYRKIKRTQKMISLIDNALDFLEMKYDALLAEEIANLGYFLVKNIEDREEYLEQIERVRTEAKTLVIILGQYQTEYKLLAPEDNTVKRDYQSYMTELAILSRHQNTFLKAKEITVQEYCNVVNAFVAYHEAIKRKEKK